jgi:hypothetical protein
MADSETYLTLMGSVFKVTDITRKGKDCRSVTMQAINFPRKGPDEPWVTLTVWPEHNETDIRKGDLIVARGKYSRSPAEGGGEDFRNLSVIDLWPLGPPAARDEVETSSRRAAAPDEDDDLPF